MDYQLIVSDLVYPDDALMAGDCRLREERTLEIVRRAVWGMLYIDDAGMVLTSPRGLVRVMDVIVASCQEFGLTVSEKKIEATRTCGPIPAQHRTRCKLRRQGDGINIETSLCSLAVLYARARASTSRISIASALLGQISEDQISPFTTDGTSGFLSRSGYSTHGGRGNYDVRMCHGLLRI